MTLVEEWHRFRPPLMILMLGVFVVGCRPLLLLILPRIVGAVPAMVERAFPYPIWWSS